MKKLVKNGITYKGTKRRLSLVEKFDQGEVLGLDDALVRVKELATAKFDETIEMNFKLDIKQKHSIRDVVLMPHNIGKEQKVLVFAVGEKAEEAKAAGADFVGAEEYVEKIQKGWLEMDAVIATPDMMKIVGKLGAILGRRKMMPNPKTGTVTTDIERVVKEYKAGRAEVRADKTGNVHTVIGKQSQSDEILKSNALAIFKVILKNKPSDLKGEYMKTMAFSPTMGPSVLVDYKKISG